MSIERPDLRANGVHDLESRGVSTRASGPPQGKFARLSSYDIACSVVPREVRRRIVYYKHRLNDHAHLSRGGVEKVHYSDICNSAYQTNLQY